MKKQITLIAIAFAASATVSFGATGVFGSYVGINANGGGNTFYGAQQPGSNFLTAFHGLNLGTFNNVNGDTLVLSGGELLTFKNSGGDVTGAEIQWRVNQITAPSSTGTFVAISLGFTANATFNDAANNTFSTPGDQKWAEIASTPNVLTGLSGTIANPIQYELEVFFKATTNEGDHFSNNGGSNYKATFTVVPEPSVGLLALFGLGVMALRRRRA